MKLKLELKSSCRNSRKIAAVSLSGWFLILTVFFSCYHKETAKEFVAFEACPQCKPVSVIAQYKKAFASKRGYAADGFSFPFGDGTRRGFYDAQPFGIVSKRFGGNKHLANDYNKRGGDLGEPVLAMAHGLVSEAVDFKGGWGQVVRIVHWHRGKLVESLYAHLLKMQVKKGQWVKRGQQIGTIGTAWGVYSAHLHLELRDNIRLPLGGGYAPTTEGYLDPTAYIRKNFKKLP